MCTRALFILVGLLTIPTTVGCASAPRYSQAQLNAIETRIVDAGVEETFNAASSALFDAGYIIEMSDRDAGLITGEQVRYSTGWSQFWGLEPTYLHLALSIQVQPDSPGRSRARIKSAVNGRTFVNPELIDEIWILMQRQVMMSAPYVPPADGDPPAER